MTEMLKIPPDWQPTAENINALPAPLRHYIHDLETRCDRDADTAALAVARDQVRQLTGALAEQADRPTGSNDPNLSRSAQEVSVAQTAEEARTTDHLEITPGRPDD
jgi:hypothetical protein